MDDTKMWFANTRMNNTVPELKNRFHPPKINLPYKED
jgi:hypothetical protein